MPIKVINFHNKFELFSDQWKPKIIAQMNENHFKLVKIQGEFVWHNHVETDETFIVISGEMGIHLRDKTISLTNGEMVVIPKGVDHKPFARHECQILLIEPAGTVNTGNEIGDFTAPDGDWI